MAESQGTLSYAGGSGALQASFRAPYLVLLLVADRPELGSVRLSLSEVTRVAIGRGEALEYRRTNDASGAALVVTVPDGWMSTRHLEMHLDGDQWRMRDAGSKNGCYQNAVRVVEAALADGDCIATGNTTFLYRSEVERTHLDAADASSGHMRMAPRAAQTLSIPHGKVMADMARVATSKVSVILGGETGTGKEVTARYIHECSGRRGSFVAVNCGALPANLVESELFGHRKGAFSGATSDRIGLVQASDGGTLFLDEVAELPHEAQVKLLRCLQEREIVPVGATRPIPVDLRVVAATHADLPSRIEQGLFREDLYARLAGVAFRLPPLRERLEDLGILLNALLRRHSPDRAFQFEREAVWAMAAHSWPMNIRELDQALAAATAWAERGVIELRHLPAAAAASLQPAAPAERDELREELVAALRRHGGNVSATAREMGKARVQIRRWCKKYGLDPAQFR